jgi:two-component system, cell cycle sensor histidine kinase and response regulator CckA
MSASAPLPLRVLILEDRKTDVDLLLYELNHAGFAPVHRSVDNEVDYRESLSRELDVILADYNLPQFNALEALQILQEKGLDVPFIVVTGSISEEAAVACMKNGATDYLLKDRLARLGPAIHLARESQGMRAEKRKAEEQMVRRNRELALLNSIIAASAQADDEMGFLQTACVETAHALGVDYAAAIMLDAKGGLPLIAAEHSLAGGTLAQGTEMPPTWASMGSMLKSMRVPLVMNDLARSPANSHAHVAILQQKIASQALVPLVVEGETVGGLGLFSSEEGHFTEEREALLRSVAGELSSALSRTRLERDRLRLGAVVEQSADAVIILSPEGVIHYLNAGFERMLGRSRAELLGRSSETLAEDKPEPKVVLEIGERMREGKEWRGRMRAHRRDGTGITADLLLSPIRDRTGRVMNYVIIGRDITEALALEQRYMQAQKMEAIGRLAGGIAHDFNNLLSSIMGYADLLAVRFPPGTPVGDEVEHMQTAIERAATLTRQLLVFSRKQVLEPRVVSLNGIVTETAALLRPLLGEKIELLLELDPLLRPIMADPGQLGQVIMNLALNARDAMSAGGRITLTTSAADPSGARARDFPDSRPGTYAALKIADTGSGIGPDVLPHIFEPFFTTKRDGTGLGLAIVFGIIKQSGGYIRIESEVGKGTLFEILLPASG